MSPLQIVVATLALELLAATAGYCLIRWHLMHGNLLPGGRLRRLLLDGLRNPFRVISLFPHGAHCRVCARADVIRRVSAVMLLVTCVASLSIVLRNTIITRTAGRVGSIEITKYHADMTGDGKRETVRVERMITDVIKADKSYYGYEIRIVILDGRTGRVLIESPKYETNEVGVFVTSGELTVMDGSDGAAKLEYVETEVYTEDVEESIVAVRRHRFGWNGREIVIETFESNP